MARLDVGLLKCIKLLACIVAAWRRELQVRGDEDGSAHSTAACSSSQSPMVLQTSGMPELLDFTGGYETHANCGWRLECATTDPTKRALLLRFLSIDSQIQMCHDDEAGLAVAGVRAFVLPPGTATFACASALAMGFSCDLIIQFCCISCARSAVVSLTDGSGRAITEVVEPSGVPNNYSVLTSRGFGDTSGAMVLEFHSHRDDANRGGGFVAQFWCGSPHTIGCTDNRATNYDPRAIGDNGSCSYLYGCNDARAANYNASATKDDGSCRGPYRDIFGDGAALLAAFLVVDGVEDSIDATEHTSLLPSWLRGTDPCAANRDIRWEGVGACTDTGRVSKVDLRVNVLATDLRHTSYQLASHGLCNLTFLETLLLQNTRLSGTLPEIGCLSSLRLLDLTRTALSGTLSEQLSNLSMLQSLEFYDTRISGTLPTEISHLTNMHDVKLFNTRLSGTMPRELSGNTINLHTVWVWTTQLSGTLPDEIGGWKFSQDLQLYDTKISGTLPPQTYDLNMLRVLVVGRTRLSGTLGLETNNLTALEDFRFYATSLSGTLPTELVRLHGARHLWFDNTLLSGTIPAQLGLLTSLHTVFFYTTRLSGTLPPTTTDIIALREVQMQNTFLSGTLSIELGSILAVVRELQLSNTWLSGTLPPGICGHDNLGPARLDFHNCRLSGNGSASLTGCRHLTVLDFSGNQLTTLPSTVPSTLTHLHLDNNPMSATTAALRRIIDNVPDLAAFDASFLGLSVQLGYEGSLAALEDPHGVDPEGTRINLPTGCRLGPRAPPCELKLLLYDSMAQPVKVGGLKPNLTLGAECQMYNTITATGLPVAGRRQCERRSPVPMTDDGDGTYAITIPPTWAPNSTHDPLMLALFDGSEQFFPVFDEAGTTHASWLNGVPVEYGEAECSAAHTIPDIRTGAFCVCDSAAGFVPDPIGSHNGSLDSTFLVPQLSCHKVCTGARIGGDCESCPAGRYFAAKSQECLRCYPWAICPGGLIVAAIQTPCPAGQQPNADTGQHCEACPPGRATPGSQLCQACGSRQVPAASGTACECAFGHFNSSAFGNRIVRCITQDLHTEAQLAEDQCVPCSAAQTCVTCEVDMRLRPGWATLDGSPWNVFSCPLDGACLGDNESANLVSGRCAPGYVGILCGTCAFEYDRIGQTCQRCELPGTTSALTVVFVLVGIALVGVHRLRANFQKHSQNRSSTMQETLTENPLSGEGLPVRATFHRSRLSSAFRVVYQPCRILIGFFQVITQIGPVLHCDFPERIRWVLDALQPFAVDLQSLLQIKCLSDVSWYSIWVIRTLLVPFFLASCVFCWYMHERRTIGSGRAIERCRGNLFALIFLIYPGVSNRAFSAFNCRRLSAGVAVLEADYGIDCATNSHTVFQALAAGVICIFCVGVPVFSMTVMLKRAKDNVMSDSDRYITRRVAEEFNLHDSRAADVIQDIRMGVDYPFLVNAFNSRYFYWESIDMGRKLALVGLLVIAGQGSLSQIFIGICLSVASLIAQIKLGPYKHSEDNVFKAVTDAVVLVTLIVALMVKSTPVGQDTDELISVSTYDNMLVLVFAVALPVAFAATLATKKSQLSLALTRPIDASATAKRRNAVQLFQLGLASTSEVRLLADYIDKLEAKVNGSMHVFISYRVAADASLAKDLCEQLSARTLEGTGKQLRVYLDVVRLEDGQRWDKGFMAGLANSWVIVPIVSAGALSSMTTMTPAEDWTDNVLLEWCAALELYQRGVIRAVLPLLVGERDFFSEVQAAFGGVSALPDHVSEATMRKVTDHLAEMTAGGGTTEKLGQLMTETAGQPQPTIRNVVQTLLKFQGIKVSADQKTIDPVVTRVHAVVAECLHAASSAKELTPP